MAILVHVLENNTAFSLTAASFSIYGESPGQDIISSGLLRSYSLPIHPKQSLSPYQHGSASGGDRLSNADTWRNSLPPGRDGVPEADIWRHSLASGRDRLSEADTWRHRPILHRTSRTTGIQTRAWNIEETQSRKSENGHQEGHGWRMRVLGGQESWRWRRGNASGGLGGCRSLNRREGVGAASASGVHVGQNGVGKKSRFKGGSGQETEVDFRSCGGREKRKVRSSSSSRQRGAGRSDIGDRNRAREAGHGSDNGDGESTVVADEEALLKMVAQKLVDAPRTMSKRAMSLIVRSGGLKMTSWRGKRVVTRLGELGNWRMAVQFVNWMEGRLTADRQPNSWTYIELLKILKKHRKASEALAALKKIKALPNYVPTANVYNFVVSTLGRVGEIEAVTLLMNEMRENALMERQNAEGMKGEELQRLLSANGRAEELVSLKERWQHEDLTCPSDDPLPFVNVYGPDVDTYNAAINACTDHGQKQRALALYELMLKEGVVPDAVTYGLLIEVMARAGEWRTAKTLFEEMQSKNLDRTLPVYRALALAYAKGGQWGSAVGLVTDMEAQGLAPSRSVYSAVAFALGAGGQWEAAVQTIMDMSKHFPDWSSDANVITYTGLIQACRRAGRWKEAILVFDHMKGVCPPNVGTCNVMIYVYSKAGMFDKAKEIYEGVRRGRLIPPDVAETSTMTRNVINVLRRGQRLSPDDHTFKAMFNVCASAGEWKLAETVFQSLVRFGYQPQWNISCAWLSAAAQAGQCKLATRILSLIRGSRRLPCASSAHDFAALMVNEGEPEVATDLLFELVRAGSQTHLRTWNLVIGSLAYSGKAALACDAIDSVASTGICLDGELYGAVIGALVARDAGMKDGIQLFKKMERKGVIGGAGVYAAVANALARRRLWLDIVSLATRASVHNVALGNQTMRLVRMAQEETVQMKSKILSDASA